MKEKGIDYLLIPPGANLFYLTGINAHLSTRLFLLFIPQQGERSLILPALEKTGAEPYAQSITLLPWTDSEGFHNVLNQVLSTFPAAAKVAVDNQMWAAFLLELQSRLPNATWVKGSEVMKKVRAEKTSEERAMLKHAASIADKALAELVQQQFSGKTEKEIESEIERLLIKHGQDSMSFCIVGSGPNSAIPHHNSGDRVIQPGDVVILDFGGSYNGYQSDMTRVVAVKGGTFDPEFEAVHAVVNKARATGHQKARTGVAAESVDKAVRDVIEAAGYGKYFVHRTGHGIGIDLHEDPYIIAGNQEPLEAGNSFSIEPGVYIPGRFGVRIEDIAIVTEDGEENINLSKHDIIYVD